MLITGGTVIDTDLEPRVLPEADVLVEDGVIAADVGDVDAVIVAGRFPGPGGRCSRVFIALFLRRRVRSYPFSSY
ncbi:hypothetical protein [Streptosporangium sp. NPDC000396]|uniref:hypothetical protein n=1 Tax=Streptosporangium sp. NPDC000396 TaxID=3366185 RepID=UPI00367608C1